MTVEEKIIELQKQIDELKAEVKNKFKRVDAKEYYFTVEVAYGEAKVKHYCDYRNDIDNECFENNNYFLTEERAEEVAEKINTLLKLERIHDILCPEYKPNWNDKCEIKWFIIDNEADANIHCTYDKIYKIPVSTYFSKDKIEEAIELYEEMS